MQNQNTSIKNTFSAIIKIIYKSLIIRWKKRRKKKKKKKQAASKKEAGGDAKHIYFLLGLMGVNLDFVKAFQQQWHF